MTVKNAAPAPKKTEPAKGDAAGGVQPQNNTTKTGEDATETAETTQNATQETPQGTEGTSGRVEGEQETNLHKALKAERTQRKEAEKSMKQLATELAGMQKQIQELAEAKAAAELEAARASALKATGAPEGLLDFVTGTTAETITEQLTKLLTLTNTGGRGAGPDPSQGKSSAKPGRGFDAGREAYQKLHPGRGAKN